MAATSFNICSFLSTGYVKQTSNTDEGITLSKNTPKISIDDPYQQFKLGLTPALG